ncbi:T9SS type A sorting domain-containing protein [Balneola sp. MJW-20]|uniref:T9SS type A sorting domain-containing protein n=1 Tax=Gracilimonas aurantiaca TaxID=3234185 RepID=UPI003467589A
MVRTVLYRTLKRTLHIALFLALFAAPAKMIAQSVLLPGDILTVTVNADDHSFDIIPLIDIEKGTKVFFSSGQWSVKEKILQGDELSLEFDHQIEAGTTIHVDGSENYLYTLSGYLDLRRSDKRLFTYQYEDESYRFIYGIGWGDEHIWKKDDEVGSDIPESLDPEEGTLVSLGRGNNYQYFIRNGASGTRKMLTELVAKSSNWNLSDVAFNNLGTSFNVLNPPVLQFDQTVSRVIEGELYASLNVAVFEHDGSRLSVDVVYDTLRSNVGTEDIEAFKRATINFTGISGDRVYEIQIPLKDDENYEGIETATFSLENLSSGNFGDFLQHSLVIRDDEVPKLSITNMQITDNDLKGIEILNNESVPVSIRDWKLGNRETGITVNRNITLLPGQSFRLATSDTTLNGDTPDLIIENEKFVTLLEKEKELLIWDDLDNLVINESKEPYLNQIAVKKEKNQTSVLSGDSGKSLTAQAAAETVQSSIAISGFKTSGWTNIYARNLSDIPAEAEFELYFWNEKTGEFTETDADEARALSEKDQVLFIYSESKNNEEILSVLSGKNKETPETIIWEIDATDRNENNIIDETEGINWLMHSVKEPVYVEHLIRLLSEFELNAEPVVYQMAYGSDGDIIYKPLVRSDRIPADIPFMIRITNAAGHKKLEMEVSELISEPVIPDDEERAGFTLEMNKKGFSSKFTVEFDDEGTERVTAFQSHELLQFPDQDYLYTYTIQGDERFRKVVIPRENTGEIILPVYINSNTEGEIQILIRDWNEIPDGWQITLLDLSDNSDHVLSRDKTVVFEHHLLSSETEDQETGSAKDRKDISDHRFDLILTPPLSAANEEETDLPQNLELYQNYPNPFNPLTTITFYLPEASQVRLSVFNIVGQPVATLVQGNLSAGEQMVEWDATDMPSGMYIYQLEVGNKVMTRKMTLVK